LKGKSVEHGGAEASVVAEHALFPEDLFGDLSNTWPPDARQTLGCAIPLERRFRDSVLELLLDGAHRVGLDLGLDP
jgi:hypothetical protein